MLQGSLLESFKTDRKTLPRINISQTMHSPQHLQASHRNLKYQIKSISRRVPSLPGCGYSPSSLAPQQFSPPTKSLLLRRYIGKFVGDSRKVPNDDYLLNSLKCRGGPECADWDGTRRGMQHSIDDLKRLIEQIGVRKDDQNDNDKELLTGSKCSIIQFLKENCREAQERLEAVFSRALEQVLKSRVSSFKELVGSARKIQRLVQILDEKSDQQLAVATVQAFRVLKRDPKLRKKLPIKLKMILQLIANRVRRECWKVFRDDHNRSTSLLKIKKLVNRIIRKEKAHCFRSIEDFRKIEALSFSQFIKEAEVKNQKKSRAALLMGRIAIKNWRMELLRSFLKFQARCLDSH